MERGGSSDLRWKTVPQKQCTFFWKRKNSTVSEYLIKDNMQKYAKIFI